MIKEIKLPEIAENVDVATVISIQVAEGDSVSEDQTIAEMESDKAAFDLPSDASGTVKEIKVKEGDEVKVGQVVITVETDDSAEASAKEDASAEADSKKDASAEADSKKDASDEASEKADEPTSDETSEDEPASAEATADEGKSEKETSDEKKKPKQESRETDEEKGGEVEKEKPEEEEQQEESASAKASADEEEKEDKSASAGAATDKEIPASPSVRRLARELGVNIYKVEGTGPYDRITAEDVKSYAKSIVKGSGAEIAATDDYELPDFSNFGEIERKPMDSIRKRTAGNMTASWQSIPHVFQFDKADVTSLEDFRDKHAKQVEKEGGKLTVTAILLKIVAKALETFPKFNASLDFRNKEIIYKKYINIGVAVDTERGLLVPVVRDANKKSITELSVELGEIAEKARNKKIKPDELQGGNFAISNLGGIGGTNFTPIVYRPNVAILGVSRSEVQPVFIDDDFEARLILPLSLSYDHRIIDGAEAARFLRWICESLENPLMTMF